MSEHTPGPWHTDDKVVDLDGHDQGIIGLHVRIFCRDLDVRNCGPLILCLASEIPSQEAQANARLIAAAPETAAERDHLKALNAELMARCTIVATALQSREGSRQGCAKALWTAIAKTKERP